MYFACAFKESFLDQQIKENADYRILKEAYNLFQKEDCDRGHDLIKKLVSENNSVAIVMSSIFSKNGETEEKFHERHINLLKRACKNNSSLALYAMAVYYDVGEFVEENKSKACDYFRRAAELGMPQAQHVYGIMLYYGTGGAKQNREGGLSLIDSAVKANVAEAVEFLDYLKKNESNPDAHP